jgi:hypothetical protein
MALAATRGAERAQLEATTMHPQKQAMIWINVLGGIAVLASYVWGFTAQPDAMGELWGGVPEWARPIYTVNMLLAAAGYFLFAPYILLRLDPDTTRIAGRFGFGLLNVFYLMVLVPSALWLPLTAQMVAQPSLPLWWLIRIDLALVGLGSLGLLASMLTLGAQAPRGRWLAVIGLLPFCLQTAILDGLVWPAYFPIATY